MDLVSVTSVVAGKVKPHHLQDLALPFTKEDVEEALFEMQPTKAPGCDGSTLFYRKFWHIIGEEVSRFFLQVLHGKVSPGTIHKTLLVSHPGL